MPKVIVLGQGGLMDIELHPNYKENGWIYLSYASSEDGDDDTVNTTIMRAKVQRNELTDKVVLYKASPDSDAGQHFEDGQGKRHRKAQSVFSFAGVLSARARAVDRLALGTGEHWLAGRGETCP